MEIKKAKTADLESKRATRFLLGLVLVLSVLFVAAEYNANDEEAYTYDLMADEAEKDIDFIPMTRQDDRVPLPAPEPRKVEKPNKIKVVDDLEQAKEAEQLPTERQQLESDGEGTGEQASNDGKEERAQALLPAATNKDGNPLNFRVVEDLPQFPGGAVELMKWLTKNLRYPSAAQRQKVQGKVVVQFIINNDGTMANLEVVKSLNADCDREALRVMRMMPKWKPGVQDGKPCRTKVCIPIVFKL